MLFPFCNSSHPGIKKTGEDNKKGKNRLCTDYGTIR